MSYREELIQVAAVAIAAIESYDDPERLKHTANMQIKVIEDVLKERQKQEKLWGMQRHTPIKWFLILGEEVGEVANAILEKDFT